jgi:hypothetical protein
MTHYSLTFSITMLTTKCVISLTFRQEVHVRKKYIFVRVISNTASPFAKEKFIFMQHNLVEMLRATE